MEFAQTLVSDNHPGAMFLRKHLNVVRRTVSDSPRGALLLTPVTEDGKGWKAAAGVTEACGCLKVHFFYVRPEFRNTTEIEQLFRRIIAVAKSNHCAYVLVLCPLVEGVESLHDFFSAISEFYLDDVTPDGDRIRTYRVTFDTFAKTV